MPETEKNIVAGARRARPPLVWLPLIAVVLAASLLSGCAAQGARSSGQEPQAGRGEQTSNRGGEGTSQRDAGLGHPELGDSDAPVVMVEYGDFQ